MRVMLTVCVCVADESGLLVHCISGWDRTPLFVSLLRLSLWAVSIYFFSFSLSLTHLLFVMLLSLYVCNKRLNCINFSKFFDLFVVYIRVIAYRYNNHLEEILSKCDEQSA